MSYEISRELLSMFDGTNDAQIFIAINGNVYDVTPRKDFYLEGGELFGWGGKDVTRMLALNSLDLKDNEPVGSTEGATEENLEKLKKWETYYQSKYKIVGKIVE
jgi:membrane-associated progesterone receptor component